MCGWRTVRIAAREGCSLEVASEIGAVLTCRLRLEEDEWVCEELSLALAG